MAESFVTPTCLCPHCGTVIDRASSPGHTDAPVEGDITVCFRCAQVSTFNANLTLKAATPEKLTELGKDSPDSLAEITKVQTAIIQMNKWRAKVVETPQ